jgi:hypothetical protein
MALHQSVRWERQAANMKNLDVGASLPGISISSSPTSAASDTMSPSRSHSGRMCSDMTLRRKHRSSRNAP